MIPLDSHLKDLLKKYHLQIAFLEIEGKGYLVNDTIVVNNNLSDDQLEQVILHEIGHAKNDHQIVGTYSSYGHAHTCSEHQATRFLIHEKVKEYIVLGNEPDTANYINIATGIGVTNFTEVREELLKYKAR